MAEAFLQVLLDNLSSLIKGQIGMILGVDDEMKKLASTLTTIQAVLEDAEDKQVDNKPIQNWLRKLKELAFEIDDILDEVPILQHKNSSERSRYSLKNILYQHKIGRRIKKLCGQLDAVAAEREKFHLRVMDVGRHIEFSATRETESIPPDRVYGRDDERDKIVDILVNQVRDCEHLSVLPIIGIGGLGKTTLAQLVYNNPRVSEHFETKLWVYVSYNFDVKTLVKAMIESAKVSEDDSNLESTKACGDASDSVPLDVLQRRLLKLLNHKRYLLILDDVWSDDQEKWAMLRKVLACGPRGASVVVTTRLKSVADIMGTRPAHFLEGLPEEHCWLLFKQRAFVHETEEYRNLEPIGRQIVKKCAGVPLAAKALGGLCRKKRKVKEWLLIKESEIWNLREDETLLPALRLSYHYLPSKLRQCFAYCAVFPKGSGIEKEELIFHWIAHNCISSNEMEVEDVGDQVLDELVVRSLLQETTSIFGGNFFKMHDLVHDLAQSIMENKLPGAQAEEKSDRSVLNNNRIRHIDLRRRCVAFPVSIRNEADICFTNFNRLRMLNASGMEMNELPSEIGNLKHLRSLDLSRNTFRSLPNSVCRLWNLKILKLSCCYELVDLPKKMRYMCNLRHLFLDKCSSLSKMPYKIGELTSLKTLSVFIVDDERGNQLGELHRLNLGGKLEIRHLERVKNHMDAERANLVEKRNLRDLLLKWERGEGASSSRENMDEKVIEALVPHRSLETLMISGYKGTFLPHWLRNSTIDNLVRIEMEDCSNCFHVSSLGNLPRLKFLRLQRLTSLEYVSEDDVRSGPPTVKTKFQSLEELELESLPNLKMLFKEEMGEILPNLRSLIVCDCYMLMLPPLSSLKELRGRCSQLNLKSFSKLDNLTSLILRIGENIPKEAFENLHNLEKLVLWNAHEECVDSEGLRCLKSLKELSLLHCMTMRCLPDAWLRHLTALETLEFRMCPELVELPEGIKFLHSLKHLQLVRLEGMISLPEVIQQIPSLQTLDICCLSQLTSLPDWLGNITSLEGLTIDSCDRLASLPASIQGMTNLKKLHILGCGRELARRCEKEKGEDWHKIAHIEEVVIMHLV